MTTTLLVVALVAAVSYGIANEVHRLLVSRRRRNWLQHDHNPHEEPFGDVPHEGGFMERNSLEVQS